MTQKQRTSNPHLRQSWQVTNISANTHDLNLDAISNRHKKRSERYKLLGYARWLLMDAGVTSPRTTKPHRTRFCHAVRHFNSETISIQLNDDLLQSEARIGGVFQCDCVWSCPVCAARKMTEKGQLVEKAISWSQSNGLIPVMVTLTARHTEKMKLGDFKNKFKASYRHFTNTRQWRDFKEAFGVRHHITNREITYGDNGWHYHSHMLLFVDKNVISEAGSQNEINTILTEQWMHSLSREKLDAIPEIALNVKTTGVKDSYLTKMGLIIDDTGALEYEMTGQETKSGKSIFQILKSAYHGDKKSADLYVAFVIAMTGDDFLTCSHGLHELLDGYEMPADEQLPDSEPKMHDWLYIRPVAWALIRRQRAFHKIVDIAAQTRDVAAIDDLLDALWRDIRQIIPDWPKPSLDDVWLVGDISHNPLSYDDDEIERHML